MLSALSLSAISFALISSQAPTAMQAPIVAVSRLADLPNTTVHYYDVTGKDIAAVNRSIAKQRPKVPGSSLSPASLTWNVKAAFDQRTENAQCKVTAARATLTATADLPRLVNQEALDGEMLGRWRHYAADLETGQLIVLVFVHSRLGQIEQAMLASDCQNAKAAGTAAIEQLRNKTAALKLKREESSSLSQWLVANADLPDEGDKVICEDIAGPPSSRNTLHLCMLPRDWETLRETSQ